MNDLYQDNILDHAHNPRNKISFEASFCGAICGEGDNPSCGDSGEMCVVFVGQLISEVSWTGVGCAISQASMSIVSDYVKGKSITDLRLLMPGDIYNLLGIQITPSRVNCALLPYRAVEKILEIC